MSQPLINEAHRDIRTDYSPSQALRALKDLKDTAAGNFAKFGFDAMDRESLRLLIEKAERQHKAALAKALGAPLL